MNFRQDLFSTYSIVAFDPDTGQLGGAVQTHQMSVGSRVLWIVPHVGAFATQSLANFSLGPMAIAMLREGVEPARIIDALAASDQGANRRQLGIVNAKGQSAAWTGNGCIREASHHSGENYSVQANMMTRSTVIPAMAEAFEKASGDLAQRMMAALEAAQVEDGDIRGMQSAALKVVPGDLDTPEWQVVYDLRVDEHENPVRELARLVRLRNAALIDNRGYEALGEGNKEEALRLFAEARAQAPELEEVAYWQAITLSDQHADLQTAVEILRPMLAHETRQAEWIELIRRLVECKLISRAEAGDELIRALTR